METMAIATMADRSLIRLLAWLSPAFPTGGFAYSHGLEWAVDTNEIVDGATLHAWLSNVLKNGSGRNDTILLRHAHRSARDPSALAEIVEIGAATAASRERRAESLAQGNAFAAAAVAWQGAALPPNTPYSIAVGALAGANDIPEDDTAAAYLQAFATNLISAAVRLVPLGQNAGLRVLAALEPIVLATAADSREATIEDLGGCAFRSDLAAMRHETQYTRLFRS